jgi:hypothetical protein
MMAQERNVMNDKILKQIEQHLNEQGAEMTALKIVLLGLVSRVIIADPMFAEEQLEQMKSDALGALSRTPSNPQNSPIDEQRAEALAAGHIDSFFHQLAVSVSAMRNKAGQSGRN